MLPECAPATLHGDCHVDQAWFDGERIVLFDFDSFVLGDPMQDLASFLTHLPGEQAPGTMACLIEAYARCAPQHFCPVRLAWHLAVQQFVRAIRAFAFQSPGWPAKVQRHLARAEALALQAQLELAA